MANQISMMMWVVYDHPKDHPDGFIARQVVITDREIFFTTKTVMSQDLAVIRKTMTGLKLVMIPRSPTDDPGIVEQWL